MPDRHDKTKVRQGRTTNVVRHVLWISIALAVIGMLFAYSVAS